MSVMNSGGLYGGKELKCAYGSITFPGEGEDGVGDGKHRITGLPFHPLMVMEFDNEYGAPSFPDNGTAMNNRNFTIKSGAEFPVEIEVKLASSGLYYWDVTITDDGYISRMTYPGRYFGDYDVTTHYIAIGM